MSCCCCCCGAGLNGRGSRTGCLRATSSPDAPAHAPGSWLHAGRTWLSTWTWRAWNGSTSCCSGACTQTRCAGRRKCGPVQQRCSTSASADGSMTHRCLWGGALCALRAQVVLRPKDEQAYAAQQATLVNHAYSILRQPLSRANYIVSKCKKFRQQPCRWPCRCLSAWRCVLRGPRSCRWLASTRAKALRGPSTTRSCSWRCVRGLDATLDSVRCA